MDLLLSIILTLSIIIIYIIMIQVFTVLFRITGLTKEKARFQVISLLTNSGYTTSESEIITNNRDRRRIATSCMITGTIFNVLIVSLIINIFFNLKPLDEGSTYFLLAIAFLVFFMLLFIMKIPFINRSIERFIELIADKLDHKKRKENVITVLDIYGKNAIVEVHINKLPEFLDGVMLKNSNLTSRYNLNILLIKRGNRVIDVKSDTILAKNDSIIVFGLIQNIKDIFALEIPHVEKCIDHRKENVINLIENHGIMATAEVIVHNVPKEIKDISLEKSPLKSKYNLNILMMKKDNEIIIVDKNTIIEENDSLIIFGPYSNIKSLFINLEEK